MTTAFISLSSHLGLYHFSMRHISLLSIQFNNSQAYTQLSIYTAIISGSLSFLFLHQNLLNPSIFLSESVQHLSTLTSPSPILHTFILVLPFPSHIFFLLLAALLHCALLYFTLLYSALLYCALLYFALLYFTPRYSTLLQSTSLFYFTSLDFTLFYSSLLYFTPIFFTLFFSTSLDFILFFSTSLDFTLFFSTLLDFCVR